MIIMDLLAHEIIPGCMLFVDDFVLGSTRREEVKHNWEHGDELWKTED